MRFSLLLLSFAFVVNGKTGLSFGNDLGKFVGSFLTDCSVCRVVEDVRKNADVKVLIENKFQEFCKKAPSHYKELCEMLATKSAVRLANYVHKLAESTQNCEKLCVAPKQISAETVCPIGEEIHENFDFYYSIVLTDASEYCKSKSNSIDCMEKVEKMAPLAKKVVHRFFLGVIKRIDPVKHCGIGEEALFESSAFAKIAQGGQGDALPLECSLCSTVAEFFAQATSVQLFDTIFGDAVVAVCKLIQPLLKGIDCQEMAQLGNLLNYFCPIFSQSPINGGTALCSSLFPGVCPAPAEDVVC